jgi:hypothetical protein
LIYCGLRANGRTVIPNVTDYSLIAANESDHNGLQIGEPADNANRNLRVEGVGHAPQFVAASLAYTLEGRRLPHRLLRKSA